MKTFNFRLLSRPSRELWTARKVWRSLILFRPSFWGLSGTGTTCNFKTAQALVTKFTEDNIQWNPDFLNLLGKSKLVGIIEVFEKSGVKLQCLTGEGKSVLVGIIGSFKNRGFEKSEFYCTCLLRIMCICLYWILLILVLYNWFVNLVRLMSCHMEQRFLSNEIKWRQETRTGTFDLSFISKIRQANHNHNHRSCNMEIKH